MNKLNQKGLSLIEVMIALAVFSFGLLALAALMASGLKYNTSALHRSYATSQAYDMGDRMRANRLGLDAGYYNNLSDSGTDPDCIESSCTPEQMAQYDAWQWNTETRACYQKVRVQSVLNPVTPAYTPSRSPGTTTAILIPQLTALSLSSSHEAHKPKTAPASPAPSNTAGHYTDRAHDCARDRAAGDRRHAEGLCRQQPALPVQ